MKRIEKVILATFFCIFFVTLVISRIYSCFFLKDNSLILVDIQYATLCAITYLLLLWVNSSQNKILPIITFGVLAMLLLTYAFLAFSFEDVKEAFLNFRIILEIINGIFCIWITVEHSYELEKCNLERLIELLKETELMEEILDKGEKF